MPLWQELWEYILEKYLTPKYGVYQNIEINTFSAITPAMIFFAIFFAIMTACAITIFNRRTLGRPVRLLLKHDAVGRKNAKTLEEIGMKKPGVIKFFINRFTLSKAIRCVEEDEFYGIPEDEDIEAASENESAAVEAVTESDYEAETASVNDGSADEEPAPARALSRSEYKKKLKREKREEAKRLSDAKVDEINSRSKNAYYVAAASRIKYKRRAGSDRFYIQEGMQYRAAIRFSSKGSNPVILVFVAVGYIIIGLLVIKFLPDMLRMIDGAIGNFK